MPIFWAPNPNALAVKTKIDDRRVQAREYQEVFESISTTQCVKRDKSQWGQKCCYRAIKRKCWVQLTVK